WVYTLSLHDALPISGLAVLIVAGGDALRRKVLEHGLYRRAAGCQQGHLMGLQVAVGAGYRLFAAQLTRARRAQQRLQGLLAVDRMLEGVAAGALHRGLRQAQFGLQFAAGAQALLQLADALAQQA